MYASYRASLSVDVSRAVRTYAPSSKSAHIMTVLYSTTRESPCSVPAASQAPAVLLASKMRATSRSAREYTPEYAKEPPPAVSYCSANRPSA